MNRRGFLGGLAGILASGYAPAAIGSGVLMPVRSLQLASGGFVPRADFVEYMRWTQEEMARVFAVPASWIMAPAAADALQMLGRHGRVIGVDRVPLSAPSVRLARADDLADLGPLHVEGDVGRRRGS